MGAPHPAPRRAGRLQRILAAFGFGRSPDGSPDRTPLSSDRWAPGDMAECVVDGHWFHWALGFTNGPDRGFVAIVREVRLAPAQTGEHRLYLGFARWPVKTFDAAGFRKLTPRADAIEVADPAFLDQLKNLPAPIPAIAALLKGISS